MNWERFGVLLQRGDKLDQLLEKEILKTGFVNRLLGYCRKSRSFNNGNVRDGLYISHMSYDFARNLTVKQFADRGLADKDYQEFVGNWKENSDYLKNAEIPLHYSIYKNRT